LLDVTEKKCHQERKVQEPHKAVCVPYFNVQFRKGGGGRWGRLACEKGVDACRELELNPSLKEINLEVAQASFDL